MSGRLGSGRHALAFRRLGFVSRTVAVDATDSSARLDVVLAAVPHQLDAETIRATAPDGSLVSRGFYDRMVDAQKGLIRGSFITPEELELRKPSSVSQILYGVPGIRVARSTTGGGIPMSGSGNCIMTVFLDGSRFQAFGGDATSQGTNSQWSSLQDAKGNKITARRKTPDDIGIDGYISASDVAAIEVYPRGVSAPARFQLLNGTCGVLAIWTKG